MSAALNDINITTSHAAVGYFVDQKKGEVNELKQLLRNLNVEKDMRRKREIIKKVIAYMTLGIDVSRLFSDMIMAIETRDIVIKKMVYLYLCNYARSEPEMAIMCINTLRRDCDNEDPMVRGLALRSLCGLRMESIIEYVEKPLEKSLTDLSSYVRKTGVMGVLKLNSINPTIVQQNGYLNKLYGMLQDVDATVVTNALHAINELQISQGGIEINQSLLMGLLNRIGEFSEWGLNTILDLVARYTPKSEDEIFAIMNLLDPVLRTANSGAVIATLKCFLKLTASLPDLHPQIYQRSKPPLLTLVTGAHPESQFSVLKHIQLMLHQPAAKGIFDEEYRQFFVRYNEPPHVKHLKVDILPLISNETNAIAIATELGEYVADVDAELSRRAIRAIGEIGMSNAGVAVEMVQTLIELIDMDSSYVRSEAALVVTNVVRLNPAVCNLVLPFLSKWLKRVEGSEAKAALIWMLGEYGDKVIEAPYLLEPIIDNEGEEVSVCIKLQVLTAAMKLFFKRPPEMQAMLGRLLSFALNDSSNQDLHDRALMYYRLLKTDLKTTEAIFKTSAQGVNGFEGIYAERKDFNRKNKLFKELNTLAVIYEMPSVQFINEKYQLNLENMPVSDFEIVADNAHNSLLSNNPATIDPSNHISEAPAVAPAVVGSVNLLDWDDDVPTNPAPTNPVPPVQQQLRLADIGVLGAVMTPAKFQQMWGGLPEAYTGRLCLLSRPATVVTDIEMALRNGKIYAIASGPLPSNAGFKLFIYGIEEKQDLLQAGGGSTFLVQFLQLTASNEITITLKTDTPPPMVETAVNSFKQLLVSSLQGFGPMV